MPPSGHRKSSTTDEQVNATASDSNATAAQTDVCNITTPNRRLHHHGSNGSMSVALRPKSKSDPRCNLAVRKKKRTHKTPSWFANTKVYSSLHLLVVVEKGETVYEK